MQPTFSLENSHPEMLVVGIDEAGRGPLAGPVVAACVLLNKDDFPSEINDSKKLVKEQRKKIFSELKKKSRFGIGIVDEKVIDQINILQATKLAMFYAYRDLTIKHALSPQILLVDGNVTPFDVQDNIERIITVVKGDEKSLSIAAASIIAKETRDAIMRKLHRKYSAFGFNRHVGYATKTHLEKIKEFGICEIHRKSFEPIKSMVQASYADS